MSHETNRHSHHLPSPVDDLNSLNLPESSLFGRQQELKILHEAYKKCEEQRQVVVLHGVEGCGKTALIRSCEDAWTSLDENCIFVTGAAKRRTSTDVVEQSMATFQEFWNIIQKRPIYAPLAQDIKEAIRRISLGEEDVIMRYYMPWLFESCFEHNTPQQQPQPKQQLMCEAKLCLERLKVFCGIFLTTFSTRYASSSKKLVIVLDEMLWNNKDSLDLFFSVISDQTLKGIVFLVPRRDYDLAVDDSTTTTAITSATGTTAKKYNLAEIDGLVQIHVTNLDDDTVHKIICHAIRRDVDDPATMDLTAEVVRKTGGNPYSVIQFLKLLNDDGLLRFSTVSFKWEWDIQAIHAETSLSENIVDMIASTIKKLPRDTQAALTLGSCLGLQFWCRFVAAFMREQDLAWIGYPFERDSSDGGGEGKDQTVREYVHDDNDVESNLQSALDRGFVIQVGDGWYKFSHDKIHRAAYSLLMDKVVRDRVHLLLGQCILSWNKTGESGAVGIEQLAIRQLDRGSSLLSSEASKVELAQLNLSAADEALKEYMIYSASKFLDAGISLLGAGEEKWTKYYPLCLELHNKMLSVSAAMGENELCLRLGEDVFKHGLSIEDKFIAYSTRIDATRRDFTRSKESVKMAIEAFNLFGGSMPKSPRVPHVIASVIKTRSILKGLSDDELLQLPIMKDPSKLRLMELLDKLLLSSFVNALPLVQVMVWLKMVRYSVRYGLTKYASIAFVGYGIILVHEGLLGEAYRFGVLGLKLGEKKIDSEMPDLRAILLANLNILFLKRPFHDTIEPTLKAYHEGIRTGNLEIAFISTLGYCVSYLFFGLPLAPFETDLTSLIAQALHFGQLHIRTSLQIFHQLILNLQGQSKDPLVLKGSSFDQENVELSPKKKGFTMPVSFPVALSTLALAYIFGAYEKGWEIVKQFSGTGVVDTSIRGIWFRTFEGLTAFALARAASFPMAAKKYRTRGRALIVAFKKLVKDGSGAYLPSLLFLQAEDMSLGNFSLAPSSKTDECRAIYDNAIKTASRSGMIHYAALLNERAGSYFLDMKDDALAEFYLVRALELFQDWGADAKAEKLKKRYVFLEKSERSSIQSAVGVRGKVRVNVKESIKLQPMDETSRM